MWDFLSFQTFITPTLLIVAYYMGAVLMPLLSYIVARYIKKRVTEHITVDIAVENRYRYLFYLSVVFCFLCMELMWRVVFEFMIAYFDMHNALTKMATL